jgi:protocatechuate 3,4-dioxygenase, alpha subunit
MIPTPSQTVGPFFRIGLIAEEWVRPPGAVESQIEIRGTVLDADSKPVLDAMIEVWQADSKRFIRVATDPALGTFLLRANLPQQMTDADGSAHAPHLTVGVFARGLLKRLHTRIYLAGEPLNASDPILALVPIERRPTLLAQGSGDGRYLFDIRLAGTGETVFFEC